MLHDFTARLAWTGNMAVARIKPLKPMNPEASYPWNVRWDCGRHFTQWGRFEIIACVSYVQVSKMRPYPLPPEWTECFPLRRFPWRLLNGERTMASKWIKAAVSKRQKTKAESFPVDKALVGDRPALTDFMSDLEGPNGGVREVSALMICFTADGVRAGLKDEDAGGWCWREGSTLADALDAIESALQKGEGAFRGPRSAPKKKGK